MFKVFIYIYFWSLFFVRHGSVCSRRRGGGCGPASCGGAAGLGRGCAGPAWLPAEKPQPEPGAPVGLKQHFVSRPLPVPATPTPTAPQFLPASPRAPAEGVLGTGGSPRPSPWLSKGGHHHGPLGWAGLGRRSAGLPLPT